MTSDLTVRALLVEDSDEDARLVDYVRELQDNRGYGEVVTPQILDSELWRASGHWDHYREAMFFTEAEEALDSGLGVRAALPLVLGAPDELRGRRHFGSLRGGCRRQCRRAARSPWQACTGHVPLRR